MKKIQTKTTVTLMLLAAGALAAFGQNRGQRGWDRGSQPTERPQSQQRSSEQRSWQGRAQTQSRPDTQFQQQRQQSQQYQRPNNFEQHGFSQPQQMNRGRGSWQERSYQPETRGYRDQGFRQQEYRGGSAYRGDNRSGSWQNNRGYESRFGGYRGYVIPQNRFYSSFGRNHFFRVGRPAFYGGYPRFQYGGYWFNFVNAPPAFWGSDWYDNDEVYIDYNDGGYYLYDSRYPDEGVPLEVEN